MMKVKAIAGKEWYKRVGTTPEREHKRCLEHLRKLLKKGDTVYTITTRRSNYRARVRFYVMKCGKGAGILDITWDVAHVLQDPLNENGVMVNGPDDAVYNLSYMLFGETYALNPKRLW
ncbi:MAG: hypothetical protein L3J76_05985 [Candidatus Hydrothermae bacterium]|nr:hypothetical protein [Candidatus Hydrothermae bacterium]